MSSPDPRRPPSAGVSALLALALATIGFFALAVFGLGALSFATDVDIIAVTDLGQGPGIIGMAAAVGVFALSLWFAVRPARPSFFSVPTVAILTGLVHLAAVWIAVLLGTGDLIVSTAVAGDLVRGGASAVLVLSAAVASWSGVALRRTRAQHPRWPWEEHGDE
ncbi:hypothetical protein [Microbacterium sp.]|uniref:hypothetical protein n=1 Tax=Microbacterium sp. TaxID=51671 RepID=UPI0025FADCAF|nr:hypothetical protein [Microbacterium sp.]